MPKKTPDTNVKEWFLANYAAHMMEQGRGDLTHSISTISNRDYTCRPPVMTTVSQTDPCIILVYA
eukprot:7613568-Pyramimonas_sp.AAC.4